MVKNKTPLLMARGDWGKNRNVKDFHICNKRLVEDILLDTILMHGYNTGSTRPSEK